MKDAARYNEEDEAVTYGVTPFADMTEAEIESMLGFNSTDVPANENDEPREIHPEFNLGANHQSKFGPAKTQGPTPSSWAFTAVAVLEGHTSIINGQYTSLSEQQVVDCTEGSVQDEGSHQKALEAIQKTQHLATAADIPFTFKDGNTCNKDHKNALPFKITGVQKASGDDGLAAALANGPVGTGIGVDRKFMSYRSGVYSDRGCMNYNNHIVTTVGYTDSYWIVRNSWGPRWGENGYIKFTRQVTNMCNIANNAYYITIEKSQE